MQNVRVLLVASLIICLLPACIAGAAQEQQPPPTFRSRITLVPVDVRVVGRDGQPVTDLTKADFTIKEDGVLQEIAQLAFNALEPGTAASDPEGLVPTNRVFLIILGSGRHVGPVKGIQAAMNFVNQRLLPRDEVAVMAYNRVTAFTTDHQKVRGTIDRYWKNHEDIEWALAKRTGRVGAGLRMPGPTLGGEYGYHNLPAALQKQIDSIFAGPGALSFRSVFTAGLSADSAEAGFYGSRLDSRALASRSLDSLIAGQYGAHVDLASMFAGIRYLRHLRGEKHLIFVTPDGLGLSSLESNISIGAMAADARVVVHFVHTHGIGETRPTRVPNSRPAMVQSRSMAGLAGATMWRQRFAVESSRRAARFTGGDVTAFQPGEQAFKKIDEMTRSHYVLAYVPRNADADGTFRRITVSVNRPDVHVFYRHGYAARPVVAPVDDGPVRTYMRIVTALNMRATIDDLQVTIRRATASQAAPGAVTIDVHVASKGVQLTPKDGRYVGAVQAAYICGDDNEVPVGEKWHLMEFDLTEDAYQRFLKEGVAVTIAVPVTGAARYVKAVLYDANADLLGATAAQVPFPKR